MRQVVFVTDDRNSNESTVAHKHPNRLAASAVAMLMSPADGGAEADRVATDPVAAASSVTFDASMDVAPTTVRDLSITDEPIVIDAEGNIVDVGGGNDPEDKRRPDLICRGLQAAQDEIQDRGVFGSKSKDATGESRRQIWDRNWVVAQDPEPGEKIGEFETILSVVKKSDDENICD